jgi:transcriptional regulator with XRE-family HTH domain
MSKPVSKVDMYVINQVRKMRTEKGYSQKDIANMIDISIGFMGDIESNKSKAKYSITQLNELAKVFKCSIKDFFPDKPL